MGIATEARAPKVNILGLDKNAYKAAPSTLCKGCGHDTISQRIMTVAWEMGLDQTQVVKLSGIGCSSKSPTYFLGWSHGFNSVHGRMPSVATGAIVANHQLKAIGVSGDGDTVSIGIGQFKHVVRRNVPMVYIVENNGVYGLTKGQFSATSDLGQRLKHAGVNELPPLDVCIEALAAGATFVARSFAGDPRQVEALLKAAMSHRGIAVLDIISPCVTFNNHEESTKSYSWGKSKETALNELVSFVPAREEIYVGDYESELAVTMHDGSRIVLKKLDPDYDPTDKANAVRMLEEARQQQLFITGLIYVNESERPHLLEMLHLTPTPLASLPESKLRPSREALQKLIDSL
ncbi:MAG TPA: 2-oxoacid:ferredoxin oxidoreductase subunit beta [Anaerolineae bacterium]